MLTISQRKALGSRIGTLFGSVRNLAQPASPQKRNFSYDKALGFDPMARWLNWELLNFGAGISSKVLFRHRKFNIYEKVALKKIPSQQQRMHHVTPVV